MKQLLFVLLLIMPLVCLSQKNPCKKIKKEIDKSTITYKSPDLKHLSAIRQISNNPFFIIRLRLPVASEYFNIKGATIEFEDGSTIGDNEAKVVCNEEMAIVSGGSSQNSMANSGHYLLQAFVNINEKNKYLILNKKILKIQIDNISQKIRDKEAILIMSYVRCLWEHGQ